MAYPLSQSLLLLLLALFLLQWRKRRLALCCAALSFSWLYLCSTALFADSLMAGLENDFRPKAISVIPEADAIVVLGGVHRGDTHFGARADLNAQADRLLQAVALYRANKAPFILLSGGATEGSRPEAEMMRETLLLMGIPKNAIVLERQSKDTHDNAVFSAIQLQGRQVERILLVTSAFHMRRALPLFQKEGLEVVPAATDYQQLVAQPTVPRWLPMVDDLQRSTYALREYVGFYYYSYRGWI